MDENQNEQIVEENEVQIVESTESKWKTWTMQLYRFLRECRRVLKVTHKPSREEFVTTAKVSAIGMGIIGLIGFILTMIKQLLL